VKRSQLLRKEEDEASSRVRVNRSRLENFTAFLRDLPGGGFSFPAVWSQTLIREMHKHFAKPKDWIV
jgi:hypothetical protein